MDDAVVVQVGHAGGDAVEPGEGLVDGHAVGMRGDGLFEALAGDVLHDDPVVAPLVLPDVVDRQQVGVLEVEALLDAAELDVEVAADQLQGDFLAGVAGGVVDLAEPAVADAALDRVAVQRPRPAGIGEPRHAGCRRGVVGPLGGW